MAQAEALVIGSHNCLGAAGAAAVMIQGGSPVDAVEAAIRPAEDNSDDHTVGYSGWPNLLGEVECDAGIMDGDTLRSGAVGALQGYRHPISVARCVMERLVHSLLVGEGASRFAAEMGCEPRDMLSTQARQAWTEQLRSKLGLSDPASIRTASDLSRLGRWAVDPEQVGGTVTCIARNDAGRLACGASTSGFAWKYPGRIGDSPIVGAGLYADSRFGAAVCTGFGEWTMSAGTARSIVVYMKTGMTVDQAVAEAMRDLQHVTLPIAGVVNVIAMDSAGRHFGATTDPAGGKRHYLCATAGDEIPAEIPMVSMRPPPTTPAGRALHE